MGEQRYDEGSGDAIVENARFLCEHENTDGTPADPRVFENIESGQRCECPDCGTVWIVWELFPRTLAKAVVVAV